MIKKAKDLKLGDCIYTCNHPHHINQCYIVTHIVDAVHQDRKLYIDFEIENDCVNRACLSLDPDQLLPVYGFRNERIVKDAKDFWNLCEIAGENVTDKRIKAKQYNGFY
jgi:hypothetical protein